MWMRGLRLLGWNFDRRSRFFREGRQGQPGVLSAHFGLMETENAPYAPQQLYSDSFKVVPTVFKWAAMSGRVRVSPQTASRARIKPRLRTDSGGELGRAATPQCFAFVGLNLYECSLASSIWGDVEPVQMHCRAARWRSVVKVRCG